MAIENINGLSPALSPLNNSQDTANKVNNEGFGTAIKDAIDSIESSQNQADKEIARAVTGESPDLHKTIIALQSADLKFQLGLQVRNKLIGAYEEIMRMQV